ncbi:hypothetical protein CCS79_00155 [Clostridium diolis]|nr:hypothetical protein CCS79_00155 [Clostridium diolis]
MLLDISTYLSAVFFICLLNFSYIRSIRHKYKNIRNQSCISSCFQRIKAINLFKVKLRIQDDFYSAVNRKWLNNGKNHAENSDEKKIINLYKNTLNIDERNKQGIGPIKGMLEELRNIKTIDDLSELTLESKVESPLIEFSL